jgi:predicted metal-dependent hydrolase
MIGWKGRKVFNRHLRQQRLLSLWALRRVFSYLRPGFHPDDHDTNELVTTWRATLFGDAGTLNDKLAGRAA